MRFFFEFFIDLLHKILVSKRTLRSFYTIRRIVFFTVTLLRTREALTHIRTRFVPR
jgi:hypothetical protein